MTANADRFPRPALTRQHACPPPRESRMRAQLRHETLQDMAEFIAAGRLDMARECRAQLRWIREMSPAQVRDLWLRSREMQAEVDALREETRVMDELREFEAEMDASN